VRTTDDPAPAPDDVGTPAVAETATIERGRRFKPALLWSYLVSTGMYVITALITFVLAAILGPEEYGLLWMALVWVTLGQVLLQHGPTMAVIQHENITDDHLDAAFWSTMIGAVVFTTLLAAAAPLWAAFNGLPELTLICLALASIVPLYALNVIPEAVLRRRLQLRGIAVRYLAAGLLSGLVAIGCALAGLGVWALVVQQVTLTVTVTVTLWLTISWRPRLRRFGPQLRDIRGTSVKTLLGAVGDFVVMRADVLLMGAFFGPVVVGLFRFAVRVPEMVVDLTARGLRNVSLPDLARHAADRPALADRLSRLVRAGAAMSIPMLGVAAAAAEPFVLLIGEQWAEAVQPLRVLCVASAITIVGALFVPTLQAAQRPGLPAIMTWASAACMTGGIYLAARLSADAGTLSQLLAVAWALVAVHIVLASLMGYMVFARVLRVSAWPTLRAVIPSVLAGGAAVVFGSAVPGLVDGGLPVVPLLLLTGGVAGVAGGAVLLALDGQVRSWVRQAGRRLPARGR
jgi:PST family polysaccharide transporter